MRYFLTIVFTLTNLTTYTKHKDPLIYPSYLNFLPGNLFKNICTLNHQPIFSFNDWISYHQNLRNYLSNFRIRCHSDFVYERASTRAIHQCAIKILLKLCWNLNKIYFQTQRSKLETRNWDADRTDRTLTEAQSEYNAADVRPYRNLGRVGSSPVWNWDVHLRKNSLERIH